MLGPKSFLSALACLSITEALALPKQPSPVPSPDPIGDCIAPAIALNTVVGPFTLAAIESGSGFETYPLQLPTSRSKHGDQPFITTPEVDRSKRALFRLTNGKLTTGGPNSDKYQAYFGPVPPISPSPPSPLLFSKKGSDFTGFYASYACVSGGATVLVLNAGTRKLTDDPFSQ